MRRRKFITLLGGAAAAWPLSARAQQPERMRRIGWLMAIAADDPEGQARLMAFVQGLQQLGWTVGQNVRIDYRWGGSNADDIRKYAAELVALAPDVILAQSSASVAPLLLATRTIPVVFVRVCARCRPPRCRGPDGGRTGSASAAPTSMDPQTNHSSPATSSKDW